MMSGISQFFFENSHILLWIIGLAVAGLVIILLVVLLTNRAVKKAAKEKKPEKPLPEKVKTPPPLTRMPPPGGRLTEYLALKGFFRVGELGVLFLRAIKFLRAHIGGPAPLYHLPWYLLIGPADSGKSTMIRNSHLKLPLGEPDLGVSSNHEVVVSQSRSYS
jgi:type VI secretion system protein ImpL